MDTFAEECWTNGYRKQISKDILEWVGILGGNPYRHLVLMVNLMDVVVKEGVVERAV